MTKDETEEDFRSSLPGEQENLEEKASSFRDESKMSIAWRYEKNSTVTSELSSSSSSNFCKILDLTKKLTVKESDYIFLSCDSFDELETKIMSAIDSEYKYGRTLILVL